MPMKSFRHVRISPNCHMHRRIGVLTPVDAPSQDSLHRAKNLHLTKQEYDEHLQHCRLTARDHGVEKAFKEYGVDIILGPNDSPLPLLATCGGENPISTNTSSF